MTPFTALFDSLGFPEMLVIAFVAILVFGGRLPEVMRNLGRGYARFRQGLHDVSRPIREELTGATQLPPVAPPPAPPTTPPDPYPPTPGLSEAPPATFQAEAAPPRAAPSTSSALDEPPPV